MTNVPVQINMQTNVPEHKILERAYFLSRDKYGESDLDRYYMAEKIERKMMETDSQEIQIQNASICRLCYVKYGTFKCNFLKNHIGICYKCFVKYSVEDLVKMYDTLSSQSKILVK